MRMSTGVARAPRRGSGLLATAATMAIVMASAGVASALAPVVGPGSTQSLERHPPTSLAMPSAAPSPTPTTGAPSPTSVPTAAARPLAAASPPTAGGTPQADLGTTDLPQGALDALGVGGPLHSALGTSSDSTSTSGVHNAVSRVRVTVRSSADWIALRLPAPAQVVNAALLEESGADLYWRTDGIVVSTPAASFARPAVVDLLVADHPRTRQIWKLLLPRGASGSVIATALNDMARPIELRRADSSVPQRDIAIDGATVARYGPLQVGSADHKGLVLAQFVPWYSSGNYDAYNNRPADPSASTTDPAYVRRAITSASGAGIDGFVVSYFGLPHRDIDAYFTAAATVPGWQSALMLETKVANAGRTWREKPDPAVLEQWITSALDRYRNHPSMLRLDDGRLVFFAYRADLVPADAWQGIVDRVAARGDRIAIIGSDMQVSYLGTLSGLFTYNSLVYDDLPAAYRLRSDLTRTDHILHPGRERKIWVATVTPGMNSTGPALEPRVYDRQGGDRYRHQWEAALASGADWVLVVSWNDYAEETTIEASREWGDAYLRITRDFAQ